MSILAKFGVVLFIFESLIKKLLTVNQMPNQIDLTWGKIRLFSDHF